MPRFLALTSRNEPSPQLRRRTLAGGKCSAGETQKSEYELGRIVIIWRCSTNAAIGPMWWGCIWTRS